MKYVFLGSFAVMALLSAAAVMWKPGPSEDGRRDIVWVCDDNPVRREQIDLFNQLHPQYCLKLDPALDAKVGSMEKTIIQCLAGVGPDIFDCYSGFQLAAFVRSGAARDCTEDFAARGIDINATWPAVRPFEEYHGRVYGHAGNAHAPAMWFNKSLFDAEGLPYPRSDWTWEEFLPIAARLTKRDSSGRALQFGMMMFPEDWYYVFVPQWKGHMYTPEGTRCTLDSPEVVAGLQFYQDLIFKHHVVPSLAEEDNMASQGGWGAGVITLFGAGKAAMAIGGRWWLCLLRREDFSGLRLGAVGIPRGPTDRLMGYGRSTLINANAKNLEGALAFVEFLHGAEWNDLVNRQADAIGPVMKYNYSDEFLHNPEHPEEDYNEVWRTALEKSVAREISPYVNGQQVERILKKQSDFIRTNVKTAEKAMRDATREINKAMIEILRIDPVLKAAYYEDLSRGAQPAWDNPEEAP